MLIGQAVHKRNHFAIVIGILNPAQILAAFRVIGPITFVKIEVEERRFFCRFTASRNSGIKEHASQIGVVNLPASGFHHVGDISGIGKHAHHGVIIAAKSRAVALGNDSVTQQFSNTGEYVLLVGTRHC